MPTEYNIGTLDRFPKESVTAVSLTGTNFVVVRSLSGTLRMFEDRCSHLDLPLHDARVDGERLKCRWHGASFDVDTGEALTLPASCPLSSIELRIAEDGILANLQDATAKPDADESGDEGQHA
jgi:3-phenylpropionate/trans-cinnamate dioxygenase ferredoxin subunit